MSKKEKAQFQNAFKGYKRVTHSMLKMLAKYGLLVSDDGRHYKIYRADNIGGIVVLARTPSDARAGLNTSHYLIRLIEA